MIDLDIGVVYTHERQWMAQLLTTLADSVGRLRVRLILVDNASEDGAEQWQGYLADTLVLPNWRRQFYAANLNRVLQIASARYVLLLNTDVYFDPQQECLARMVAFMDAHPRCGIAGCRVLHPDGQDAYSARRFQTLPVILARRLGMGWLLRRTLDAYLYRDRSLSGSWECDWISGCFMLLRREVLQEVGNFDTRFVKYFEDVDYCLRVARAGWRVMYYGGTHCYHRESRASKRLLSADAWRHVRAYLYWLNQWGFSPSRGVSGGTARRRAA